MVLLNYWRYLECMQRNFNYYSQIRDTAGAANWEINGATPPTFNLNQSMFAQFSVSTTSTMSPADYSLADQNNNIQFTGITTSITVNEGEGVRRIFTITGQHIASTTGSSLTINRVGIGKTFTDRVGNNHSVLLAEMDLEEPIVVQPRESFVITVVWNEG
jgi:hypothetical protein